MGEPAAELDPEADRPALCPQAWHCPSKPTLAQQKGHLDSLRRAALALEASYPVADSWQPFPLDPVQASALVGEERGRQPVRRRGVLARLWAGAFSAASILPLRQGPHGAGPRPLSAVRRPGGWLPRRHPACTQQPSGVGTWGSLQFRLKPPLVTRWHLTGLPDLEGENHPPHLCGARGSLFSTLVTLTVSRPSDDRSSEAVPP